MKRIYSVRVSDDSQELFEEFSSHKLKKEEKRFSNISYDFSHLSVEQLANLSKDGNKEAFLELFYRMTPDMIKQSRYFANSKGYLEYGDVFGIFVDILVRGVINFDDTKGKFRHFYYFLSGFAVRKADGIARMKYARNTKAFGRRVTIQDFDVPYISDIKPMDEEYQKRAEQIDIYEFLNSLTGRNKEIMILYFHRYTCRQISDLLNLPYTTVNSIIKRELNEFEFQGYLKEYHKKH